MACVFFDVGVEERGKEKRVGKKEFYLPAAELLTEPHLVCSSLLANRVWVYLAVL
jgi:hypothetical protein